MNCPRFSAYRLALSCERIQSLATDFNCAEHRRRLLNGTSELGCRYANGLFGEFGCGVRLNRAPGGVVGIGFDSETDFCFVSFGFKGKVSNKPRCGAYGDDKQ